MKQLDNVFSVTKDITEKIESPEFTLEFQNLSRFRSGLPNATAGQNTVAIKNSIDKLKSILASIDTSLWTSDHFYILEKLGIQNLIGSQNSAYFENAKAMLQASPANSNTIVSGVVTDLNNLRTKPKQFLSLLQDFDLSYNIEKIQEGEGLIEIVFQGKVNIDDFKEAKNQMNDWFLIIEGYSRLLGVPREEFEIINISKNSPARFKIKTTLKNTGVVLSIITSVLIIQQHLIQNKLLLDKLRQTQMGPDGNAQKEIIDQWENHLQEQIDDKIEKLVEKKLNQHKVTEDRGEIKNALNRGIHNQYNFIVNGGTVNVQVIDEATLPKIEKLENAKQKIKEIQSPFLNQKSLEEGDIIEDEDELSEE